MVKPLKARHLPIEVQEDLRLRQPACRLRRAPGPPLEADGLPHGEEVHRGGGRVQERRRAARRHHVQGGVRLDGGELRGQVVECVH